MNNGDNNGQLNILWTGGWDSTFRVIHSSLIEKNTVKPHYIVDLQRKSSLRELQAISDIRKALRRLDREATDRIGELMITPITEIPEEPSITEAYQNLKSRAHLGRQYDWLARYARSRNLDDLELSIHVDDKAYIFLQGKVDKDASGRWKLKDSIQRDEAIFSCFRFPLLEISKTRMKNLAIEHGFLSALEKSWFCFNPINCKPCGICNPCIYLVEEGMGYRLPREARVRYRLRNLRKAAKATVALTWKVMKSGRR